MFSAISLGVSLGGFAMLATALPPLVKAVQQLPRTAVRTRWYLLAGLMVALLPLYALLISQLYRQTFSWPDLALAATLLLGACLARMAANQALQNTLDMRRVTLLEQESITDPLIGIYNRRYLERRLDEEFERARRYRMPLSLLLLDIDHFKQVNDQYGHQTGDLVLNYLGHLLLDAMRSSDIVARYGGEEFIIIAPNTPGHIALNLAERLREHVANHKLVLSGKPTERLEINVTASIGVADLDPRIDSAEQLVHLADMALYRAKQDGRNRVASCRSDRAPIRTVVSPSPRR